ncbi:unnamed protein product, partial [Rotaria sp. Silwood2]
MTENTMSHPLVLCGLPRTGSMLLYNLLACDPASRAIIYTEMAQPVPPVARCDTAGQIQRNIAGRQYRDMLYSFGLTDSLREMYASHPIFSYEEDLLILFHTGWSWFHSLLAPHDDNELAMWLEDNRNKNFVYEYHKTFIQMLNSIDASRSHWIFKTPFHSLYIDQLMHQYPSALLIMTHRRLDEVLLSFCHLSIACGSPYFDKNKDDTAVDIQTLVKRTLHLADVMSHRLVNFRRTHQHIPCFDVLYDDLVAQPIDTIRQIYKYFGLVWSKEFEQAMTVWLHDNPQEKYGRNSYTLASYGLSCADIEQRYKEYN